MQTRTDGPETADKKERGPVSVTIANVRAVAEKLRQRRQAGSEAHPPTQPLAGSGVTSPEDSKRTGGLPSPSLAEIVGPVADVAQGEAAGPVMARAMRHPFNRHLLLCEIPGEQGLVPVAVRDSGHYRAGERFEVKKNDVGRWQAAVVRSQPRFGR
jgi:hypothetical protein